MRKLAAIGILAGCLPAFGWGPEGHNLVARIAESELTPAARAHVTEILGPGRTMVSISSWADQIRNSRRETGPWHYVDIPIDKPHLDMARDCPRGDCVIAKIEEFRTVLQDAAAPPAKRREALMFVIHFVGDMHQPLHCSDNHDRGGNEVHIVFNGRPGNLHGLWDSGLLDRMGAADALFVKFSADAERHRKKWAQGTASDWAEESHKAAQKTVYGKLPKAPREAEPAGALPLVIAAPYERKADPLIAGQIERAGVRLASLLNATLQ
jgi:hypothetical protein